LYKPLLNEGNCICLLVVLVGKNVSNTFCPCPLFAVYNR
jgi:hypothetical protein